MRRVSKEAFDETTGGRTRFRLLAKAKGEARVEGGGAGGARLAAPRRAARHAGLAAARRRPTPCWGGAQQPHRLLIEFM